MGLPAAPPQPNSDTRAAVLSPATAPARHFWATPRRLQAALFALWLAAALLLLAALVGASQRRQALQTIGYDAAPSIIGTQQIKAGLSDMDASAAQVLLLPPSIAQEQADDHYEMRRVGVTEDLTRAAHSLSLSEKERQPLRTLADALGTYETDVAQARLLHLRGEPGSRLVYRMTHSEMHDTLLPAADALRGASDQALVSAYRKQQAASRVTLALLWAAGLLLLGLLITMQIFLLRLTRRTFSPPLLGATLITAVFLWHAGASFTRQQDTLRAVNDSFASVSSLWEMRATAFDLNSEESRWLMDTPQAPQYEQLYQAQSGHLTDVAGKQNTGEFPGEQDAMRDTMGTYALYGGTDKRLRALENGGSHGAAVAFCMGTLPGQHQGAFDQFDGALGRTLAIDQKAFDSIAADGVRRQAGQDLIASLAVLGVVALIGLGLRPRLQEYAP